MTAEAGIEPRPKISFVKMAIFFAVLSATNFGGGGAARIRRTFVQKWKVMTQEEFLDILPIAQISPGPNQTNLAVLVGQHYWGTLGAASALVMVTLPGFVILMAFAAVYFTYASSPLISAALKGCAAVAVALQLSNAIELSKSVKSPIPLAFLAVTAVAVSLFHLSLLLVLGVLGSASIGYRVAMARKR